MSEHESAKKHLAERINRSYQECKALNESLREIQNEMNLMRHLLHCVDQLAPANLDYFDSDFVGALQDVHEFLQERPA